VALAWCRIAAARVNFGLVLMKQISSLRIF
jgi:hypothetical protein